MAKKNHNDNGSLLWEIVKSRLPIFAFYCLVTSVDKTNNSCNVTKMLDDTVLENVSLTGCDDTTDNYIVVYPSVGSVVIVGLTDNMESEQVVLKVRDIESILVVIGEVSFTMNGNEANVVCGDYQWSMTKTSPFKINDGSLGGVPDKTKVKANDTSIETYVTAFLTAFEAMMTTLGGGTGSSPVTSGQVAAALTTFAASMASQEMVIQDVDNPNFIHG